MNDRQSLYRLTEEWLQKEPENPVRYKARSFRLTIRKPQEAELSQLCLYDAGKRRLPWPSATIAMGVPDAQRLADNRLGDNSVTVKGGTVTFDMAMHFPVEIAYYALCSGKDPSKAPTAWTLEASTDGRSFHEVHKVFSEGDVKPFSLIGMWPFNGQEQ